MEKKQTNGLPAKSGPRLFFRNAGHYFMPLVTLNLLFFACALPLVTAGPALAALNRVCCQLADGQRLLYPVGDFFQAFRKNLRQGLAAGLLWAAFTGICLYAYRALSLTGGAPVPAYILLGLSWLLFNMAYVYVFPQIAMIKLPIGAILRNSVFLMLLDLKRALAAVLAVTAALAGPLFLLPGSIVFFVAILFSLGSLMSCSLAWPLIRGRITEQEGADTPETGR